MSAQLHRLDSPAPHPDELEGAIEQFGHVLEDLRTAHDELAARAARMEQELSRANTALEEQAKMVALGTMAGGIAHELRNPLNAVRGFASLLGARLEGEGTEARWARLIREGVDECDAIISGVLAFAAPERLTIERLRVRELIDSALDVVRREVARTGRDGLFELTRSASADLELDGDRIQLRQALRNLIANSVTAQPDGGVVHVEAYTEDGDTVLRVHDAGPGIPSTLATRVAEPFFTTRADGTGLGLAFVHTVARLHGGGLTVRATRGPLGGADVALTIPARACVPSFSPTHAPAPSDAR